MKNQVLLLLCFTACLLQSYGQTTDKQWLILNGIGKEGVSSNGGIVSNFYPPGNNINAGFFVLDTVLHPVRTIYNPRAKNDLFVIYTDGSYFSSREKDVFPYNPSIDIFYPYGQNQQPPTQNLTDNRHNFSTPSPIRFMYLSNIYEGNDPPPKLNVKMGEGGMNSKKYALTVTEPSIALTASHDVIQNADITLILKKEIVGNGYKLYFNKTKLNNTGAESTDNYFEPSGIFQNNACSNVPVTINQDATLTFGNISAGTEYIYVNLRPTSILPAFYPNNPELNSSAIFSVQKPGGVITGVLTENILMSHDPNFIQVISQCRNKKSGTYLYYHVEFYNQGNSVASNLGVQLGLPDYLDINCIGVEKWMAGGELSKGTYSNNNGVIKFTFDQGAEVQAFNPDTMQKCTGYIEFCVKFKNNQPSDLNKSHKPLRPYVFFGNDSYPITDFRPLKKKEDPGPTIKFPNNRKGCSCKCSRPVSN